MQGFLFFIGLIGSVALVAALLYFAIRRIRKKLASESKPMSTNLADTPCSC